MSIEIIRNGEIIRRSRNLRGLISHAYRAGVRFACIHDDKRDGTALVTVCYRDDSACETRFADFTVARDFIGKRAARWGLPVYVINVPSDETTRGHISWHPVGYMPACRNRVIWGADHEQA